MSSGDFIVANGNGPNGGENSGSIGGDGGPASGGFIDPASAASGTISASGDATGSDQPGSGGTGKRKRGRPPGSGKGKTASAAAIGPDAKRPVDAEGIAAILMTIHMGIAALTKTPELDLEKEEAERLARATENVAKHYNIEATEKTLAWTNLIMAGGYIYGTRIIAISARKTAERLARKQEADATNQPANVHQFMRP